MNTKIKIRGLNEITQVDLNKLQDDLQAEYGHKNQLVKNQILGKLIQWVERRQQTPLQLPNKPQNKSIQNSKARSNLDVNNDWKDQPKNDQPFYGKVELPEGME